MGQSLFNQVMPKLAEELYHYIVPIFSRQGDTGIHVGTSFLVAHEHEPFLVTAAHVLDELGTPGRNLSIHRDPHTFVDLDGTAFKTRISVAQHPCGPPSVLSCTTESRYFCRSAARDSEGTPRPQMQERETMRQWGPRWLNEWFNGFLASFVVLSFLGILSESPILWGDRQPTYMMFVLAACCGVVWGAFDWFRNRSS